MSPILFFLPAIMIAGSASAEKPWQKFSGEAEAGGWRCHVIRPDPDDDGPDGINLHDWDGDGDTDIIANYEEGGYSRLLFNPGKDKATHPWERSIRWDHGKCEDSGIGDLDNDGDTDYIANGGWIYFNPGTDALYEPGNWVKMTIFNREQRVPLVLDMDGDGLNDLVVGASSWFKQPVKGKHEAANWKEYALGKAIWPMNCIPGDVDGDGDTDLVVADRKSGIFWYDNPGKASATNPWVRKDIHPHHSMFIAMGDINGDGTEDLAIAGGNEGSDPWKLHLTILLRTNRAGDPVFKEIRIAQPTGLFPKGVNFMELDGNPKTKEIVVIPKVGDLWMASAKGDPLKAQNWTAAAMPIPGAETRKKMDNAYLADIDGDGDQDIITTEENGGWGVIWFENPSSSVK